MPDYRLNPYSELGYIKDTKLKRTIKNFLNSNEVNTHNEKKAIHISPGIRVDITIDREEYIFLKTIKSKTPQKDRIYDIQFGFDGHPKQRATLKLRGSSTLLMLKKVIG